MSTILGFLFNRFSFTLVVVLIVVALVVSGRLVWNKYIAGGLLALIVCVSLWTAYDKWEKDIRVDERTKVVTEYNTLIDKQKSEAKELLDIEIAKVKTVEAAMRNMHFEQEIKDVANTKTVTSLNRRLRDLAVNGMFRDPNATECRQSSSGPQSGNTASTSDSPRDTREGGGLLSKDLSRLLSEQTEAADKINIAYIACRADSISLRLALSLKPIAP